MIINEILNEAPQKGDAFDLEIGNLLIETIIEDIVDDNIIIKLDERALELIVEEKNREKGSSDTFDSQVSSAKRFAMQHYPGLDPDEAFEKFVIRSLMHSKDNDDHQNRRLKDLENDINRLSKNNNLTDSYDGYSKYPYGKGDNSLNARYRTEIATARNKGDYDVADEMEKELNSRTGKIRYQDFQQQIDDLHARYMQEKSPLLKKQLQKQIDDLHNLASKGLMPESKVDEEKNGLWANIHAKRKRIKAGSGERMRSPGSKGAPTDKNFKDAAKTSKNEEVEYSIDEAEYQGRKVPLGKPMRGDVKKSKVYVKGPKGNVVKVNFGDPNMKIKKSNPQRRKSFRARHNCDNPGPRWKARYWSCKAW